MKIDTKIISQELKVLRTKNNVTQKELADFLGVHQNTIRKYETDSEDMNLSLLHKWLSKFGIDEIIFFTIIREYNHKK